MMEYRRKDPGRHSSVKAKTEKEVERRAMTELHLLGGDPKNRTDLLGLYEVQFGQFRGKSFKWVAENCFGYVTWLVNNMQSAGEKPTNAIPLNANKFNLREYLEAFEDGRAALEQKREEKKAKESTPMTTSAPVSTASSATSTTTRPTHSSVVLLTRSSLAPSVISSRISKQLSSPSKKIQPSYIPKSSPGTVKIIIKY